MAFIIKDSLEKGMCASFDAYDIMEIKKLSTNATNEHQLSYTYGKNDTCGGVS